MHMWYRLAAILTTHATQVRERIRREPDGGYSAEAIAVIAALVALAVAALAILGPKITAKIQGVRL